MGGKYNLRAGFAEFLQLADENIQVHGALAYVRRART